MSPVLIIHCRRICQCLTLMMFIALPWLNAQGVYCLSGSLFAFDFFGVPFADPAMTVQAFLLGGDGGIPPPWQLLVGAGLTLILALFMGRIFCGWLCPYGFISELLNILRRKGASRKGAKVSHKVTSRIFTIKSLFFILMLAIFALWDYPVLSFFSLPGELSLAPMRFWQKVASSKETSVMISWTIFLITLTLSLFVPLVVLMLEALCGKRFWCRYLCPQSVLLGLAARCLPNSWIGLRIGWKASSCTCKNEVPCRSSCPLGCEPRQKSGPERRDCIMCGLCVDICTLKGGALRWQLRY